MAKSHGHGRYGELLQLGQRKLDGVKEPVPQLGVFLSAGLVFLHKLCPHRSTAMFTFDSRFHLLSMIIDALAAAA